MHVTVEAHLGGPPCGSGRSSSPQQPRKVHEDRCQSHFCTLLPQTEVRGEYSRRSSSSGNLYRNNGIRYTNQFGGSDLHWVLGALRKQSIELLLPHEEVGPSLSSELRGNALSGEGNKMLFTLEVVRLLSPGIFHDQCLRLSFKHRRQVNFSELLCKGRKRSALGRPSRIGVALC